jgi:hypothetical protein
MIIKPGYSRIGDKIKNHTNLIIPTIIIKHMQTLR